jgi:hypothetical protein
MNKLFGLIFKPQANDNIAKTGNVWGHTTEYDFRFTLKLPFKFQAKFEQKSKGQMWGRFGGGWNFKLGIQIGGSTVIISLWTVTIRISREQA